MSDVLQEPLRQSRVDHASALRSAYHLACLRGPDLGKVIALKDGMTIGRNSGCSDPSVSRLHVRVHLGSGRPWDKLLGRVGFVEDLGSRNGTGRRHRRRRVSQLRLRVGSTVRMGQSCWQVRQRPQSTEWIFPSPKAPHKPQRWLRWFPLGLLPLSIWRWIPANLFPIVGITLAAIVIVFVLYLSWRRHRDRMRDGAFLFLSSLALTRAVEVMSAHRDLPQEDEHRLWRARVNGKTVRLSRGIPLGIAGPDSHGHAQWLAVQLALRRGGARIRDETLGQSFTLGSRKETIVIAEANRFGSQANPKREKDTGGDWRIVWGKDPTALPDEARDIIPSSSLVSPHWLATFSAERQGTSLPETVTFEELGLHANAKWITQHWAKQEHLLHQTPSLRAWQCPVGLATAGSMGIDLCHQGPHALIVGGTGSGKSEFLVSLVTSLCLRASPERLHFLLVDYKGGASLGPLGVLPHVEDVFTDLDVSQTAWLLRSLSSLLRQRKQLLRQQSFGDFAEWERSATTCPPRLVVVVDEFQALAEDHPDLLSGLRRLCTQGRSLGLHVILATQRPGGFIDSQLRATLDLRIALRCTEERDSIDVLGSKAAAHLPRIPGRAILSDKVFQTALVQRLPVWVEALHQATTATVPSKTTHLLPSRLSASLSWESLEVTTSTESNTRSEKSPDQTVIGMVWNYQTNKVEPLRWDGKPLLLTGPRITQTELSTVAEGIAIKHAHHTGASLHLIGRGHPVTPEKWDSLISPFDAATIATALMMPQTKGYQQVFLINDLATVFAEFEAKGLSGEFRRQWEQLLTSPINEGKTIIAVDDGIYPYAQRFTRNLTRIPDQGFLTVGSGLSRIVSLLTTDVGGSEETVSRFEAAASIKGRVLTQGFTSAPIAMGQLPTNNSPLSALPHRAAVPTASRPTILPLGDMENHAFPLHDQTTATILTGIYPEELSVNMASIVIVAADHTPISVALANANSTTSPTVLSPAHWPQLTNYLDRLIIALEPSRDVLRFFAQICANQSLWALAQYPFPRNTGVVYSNGTLTRFILTGKKIAKL